MAKEHSKKNSEICYRRAIVTFVDILGFRELVSTRTAAELHKIVSVFRRFGADAREVPELGKKTFVFSDSVVRVQWADQESCVFQELLDLVHVQSELVPHGVLVRGAVTIGDIFADNDGVVGPAFVRAYDLESKQAIYPRIVVDSAVLHSLRDGTSAPAEHHTITQDYAYLRKLVCRGEDGIWFIDYLHAFVGELDDIQELGKLLMMHIQIIKKLSDSAKAAKGSGQDALIVKAHWLASYHVATVKRLAANGSLAAAKVDKADVLLKKNELVGDFSFPPGIKNVTT